jgi:hypothetical protein
MILVHFLTVQNIVVKKVVKKITISSAWTSTLSPWRKLNSLNLVLWWTFKDSFWKTLLKKSGLVYFMRRLFEARLIYRTTAVNSSSVNFTEISKETDMAWQCVQLLTWLRGGSHGLTVCTTVYLAERRQPWFDRRLTVYLAERRQPWIDRLHNLLPGWEEAAMAWPSVQLLPGWEEAAMTCLSLQLFTCLRGRSRG